MFPTRHPCGRAFRLRSSMKWHKLCYKPPMPVRKVLVADDHEAIIRLIRKVIQAPGRRFIEAKDGPSALAAWQEGGFSLLILDCLMPGLSGIEVAQRVRRAGDATPILLISGAFNADLRLQAAAVEGVDLVVKPFALQDLRGPVDRLLEATSKVPDLRLGALALRHGWLTLEQLTSALDVQSREAKKGNPGLRIGRIFLREGFLREDQVEALLGKQKILYAQLR